VLTREIDFSLYVPALSTMSVASVGTASWGPKDTRTLLTDEGTQNRIFGPPSADHLALHANTRYLRQGNQLWFVRVGTYDVAATGAIRNAADSADSVAVSGLWTGSYGNRLTLLVEDSNTLGAYKISVLDNGVRVEVFDAILVGAASAGDANYIETRINGVSAYITVTDATGEATLKLGTSALTGGDDGAPADDSDVVGTIVGDVATGMQLFRDPEEVESGSIDIFMVPGRWERTIVVELITIAEERQDILAIVDPPDELTVQEVVAWHNGELAGDPDYLTAALNSSYACMYYPWLQVFDSFNDVELFIPPSGHAASVMARTDFERDPWFAPAGVQRGRLTDVLDTRTHLKLGDREFMYGDGNAVNPIPNFNLDGVVIYGQRTLQRVPTARDRINVRRMLNVAKTAIRVASRFVVFEPNDPITYRQLTNLVNPFLRNIQSRRGIVDFRTICDETTNPPAVVEQNRVVCRILIQPTKTAEIIELEFVLLPQGANFDEFTLIGQTAVA
jgi:phage tail sheath protein FI